LDESSQNRGTSQVLTTYKNHIHERAQQGIPPEPISPQQMTEMLDLLKEPPKGEEAFLLDLITHRVPAGVDQAAYIKAGFLSALANNEIKSPLIDSALAVTLLGTMLGGYNIEPLVKLLDHPKLASLAAEQLKSTLLMFDAFHDVADKAKSGNAIALSVIQSWADGEWFTKSPALEEKITLSVFMVPGETNTDDLSPAQDAWSRPDIPLHALSMLKNPREGLNGDPLEAINRLKKHPHPIAYVGDVVGTGSSRKSATNSVLWWMGKDIPYIPNKRFGGFCLGGNIAPIFFNTMEDAGALPIEVDVSQLKMGDIIDLYPYEGKIERDGKILSHFSLKTETLLDEVRAGGRIPLIIGRNLTGQAREYLGLSPSELFKKSADVRPSSKGFTLAQKMVGKACDVLGVRAHQYCEPKMTTVGSQDTTGPMTRNELKDLACLGFSADLVMQSFCHTAAYPKPIDIDTQHTLPDFIMNRGGVSLRPGDGIIHSWLNRMLLPDTVGTGGDSHTRFPIGISFPAGSGLVAFAAATGVMPLDMPESVLVRFSGKIQPGITLRDLVNAIPYVAIQQGVLTVEKEGKKNVFSGRILEIEGLPDLKVEQAFELSDAAAERSAAGCSIALDKAPIIEYLTSNIVMLKWMIQEGYGDVRTLSRRIEKMQDWLKAPDLMQADSDAEYYHILDIDLNTIKEPILACPNDPDNVKTLSDVQGTVIDEVFIGSCMTNIGHYRAAGKLLQQVEQVPTRLWIAPPTKMDEHQLMQEGYYNIFATAGARTEMPGCSLCMGNQARVAPHSTVVSTSTRNFPNRLGRGANVYLASAELSTIAAIVGKLPTPEEYHHYIAQLDTMHDDIYRYLNFNEMKDYQKSANKVTIPIQQKVVLSE
jgi:aconitate hydratase 2/2-methylisocitrate dehydratase